MAYALQLAQSEKKDEALSKLLERVQTKGRIQNFQPKEYHFNFILTVILDNHKWWEKVIQIKTYYCSEMSKTLNVEMTAYGLLALMAAKQDSQCLPILKWLLNQRNDQGGFEGTQDTILGIEALAKIAAKYAVKDSNLKVSVESVEDKVEKKFGINKENALILQSEKLSANIRTVNVNASGHGFGLIDVSYRYYVNEPAKVSAFDLRTKAVELNTNDHIDLQISMRYK